MLRNAFAFIIALLCADVAHASGTHRWSHAAVWDANGNVAHSLATIRSKIRQARPLASTRDMRRNSKPILITSKVVAPLSVSWAASGGVTALAPRCIQADGPWMSASVRGVGSMRAAIYRGGQRWRSSPAVMGYSREVAGVTATTVTPRSD